MQAFKLRKFSEINFLTSNRLKKAFLNLIIYIDILIKDL